MGIHGFTKYWVRLKECPLSIVPNGSFGTQLFLLIVVVIAYWGFDQREIVGNAVLLYGCIDQLVLWVGQNIPFKLYDRSYVNDCEFGIQKAMMWCSEKEIPQEVLDNAWVPGSKDQLSKAVFALAQVFVFLNFVASASLSGHYDDTQLIGISDNTLGQSLIVADMVIWVAIMFSVLVKVFGYGQAQGPVLSWNVFTRIVVVSIFAGMNAFLLPTKMKMNFISIVLVILGIVIPWKDMFESILKVQGNKKD
jgi:hypothetical protein